MNPRRLLRRATLRLNRAGAPSSIPTEGRPRRAAARIDGTGVEIAAAGTDEAWNA